MSSTSSDFRAYAINQLSIFETKQREFSQRKVVRLKFKKYICTTKLCVELAKEIIGDHKNVFIAIGSSEMAPNSPIRGKIIVKKCKKQWIIECIINITGYRRVPHRKLIGELRRRAARTHGGWISNNKAVCKLSSRQYYIAIATSVSILPKLSYPLASRCRSRPQHSVQSHIWSPWTRSSSELQPKYTSRLSLEI